MTVATSNAVEHAMPRIRVPAMTIDRFLRRPAVEDATGLSKPTIYRQVAEGTFPPPEPIGKRAVAWRESHIVRWQNGERDWRRAA